MATPPGRGGVAIIRISGPDAKSIAALLCGRPDADWEPRRACLSRWLDEDGQVLDQGILLYFPAPHSFTGEDVIELQGHGSPVVMRALLQRLYRLGCRAAEPGEFTRRAVENNRMDLSQAEAVAACIDAATVRAAKQAQRQLAGEFGRLIEELMQTLTGLIAHVEASLDFPEEEIPDLYFDRLGERMQREVIVPIRRLLESAPLGERLFDGATVAIVGAPNVGKSTLMNWLVGRERAIVSDIPGTTRDIIEADFEIGGIPVRLLDTAGMRESSDAIEQEGVRRARQSAECADVVIFLADAGRPETWEGWRGDLHVMNKMDAASSADIPADFLAVSVHTGAGMEALLKALEERLAGMDIGGEEVLVTRERHRLALNEALELIESGLQQLDGETGLDLVAMEWRRAWSALGSILGIGDVEVILDRVFSEFCIGK